MQMLHPVPTDNVRPPLALLTQIAIWFLKELDHSVAEQEDVVFAAVHPPEA
jgi:hypothetical protein